MATVRDRRHLVIPATPLVEAYRPHPQSRDKRDISPADRTEHGAALLSALSDVRFEAARRRAEHRPDPELGHPGLYIQVESRPGLKLDLESFEKTAKGAEVVSFTTRQTDEEQPREIEHATIFVPRAKYRSFEKRLEAYRDPEKHRYTKMIDPISSMRLAELRNLWTDAPDMFPKAGESVWWEVWLRRSDRDSELSRFRRFAELSNIQIANEVLKFPERTITLAYATAPQLATSLDIIEDIAEVRRAKTLASFFTGLSVRDQVEWKDELLSRVSPPGEGAPAVCVFDTGVNPRHPLLDFALDADDCLTIDPSWGPFDTDGHGTEMAGLALYGDLQTALDSSSPVIVSHRLESVKILSQRRSDDVDPKLYGFLTADAVSQIEVEHPERTRFISMAVTAKDGRDSGKPSSWSAAIDALTAGRSILASNEGLVFGDDDDFRRRLFVLSAGNVHPSTFQHEYLDRCDLEQVHDPGQAWNALTVGAFTDKAEVIDSDYAAYTVVGIQGDLSPHSTTSTLFQPRWPVKPDIVAEGGNVMFDGIDAFDTGCPDVNLLSTYAKTNVKLFVESNGTSAAAAQVARMAAEISAHYPMLWPESIRALVVHSAEWTETMKSTTPDVRKRLRRYGYGVPDLDRALRSAGNALTMIVQGVISPFKDSRLNEIQTFELPWPKSVLTDLHEASVSLRATLSYFIEPNPGIRGWRDRYQYASHGLRFELKKPTESIDEFRKRMNRNALDEGESRSKAPDTSGTWLVPRDIHRSGSVHQNTYSSTAADLAEQGVIAVYPVRGWWKDQPMRDRSGIGVPYSLIVSISTDEEDIDIWTPVATQLGVPVDIEAL